MIRARVAVAVSALLLALPACSSESEPTAAPSSGGTAAVAAATSAAPATTAPAPIADEATIRQVCNQVANLGNAFDFGSDANLAAGKLAEAIADPKFSLPGRDLVKAAGAASAAPGPDTNLDIREAQRGVLDACGDKYGDGPW